MSSTPITMATCVAGAGGSGPPAGAIFAFAAAAAPTGYLLCDGAAVSRATYSTLFAAINTTYGVGDNSTTFNVPDLRGRVAVGFDSGQTEFDALAEAGGAKTSTSSGTVAAPTFTGTSSIATSAVSAGTPAGTNSAPTFTGSALATHAHELPFQKVAGGTGQLRLLPPGTFGTGTSRAAESIEAAPTANTTSAAVELSQAVTAGTPAGTVSAPTFTGSALGTHQHTLTPAGTNSAPAFTGAAQSVLQPYVTVQYIIKT